MRDISRTISVCAFVLALTALACRTDSVGARASAGSAPGIAAQGQTGDSLPDPLDINRDEIIDFIFEKRTVATRDVPSSGGSTSINVVPRGGSRLVFRLPEGSPPVEDGVTIPADVARKDEWTPYPVALMHRSWSRGRGTDSIWQGPWAGASRLYMPVEINVDTAVQYGWVRMSCDERTGRVTVHDYSFQPNSGASIRAGERP